MKKKLLDKIIIIIMVCCILFLMYYYFDSQTNECTKNPLAYASKMFEEKYGEEFVGSGFFLTEKNSPLIIFNSTGYKIIYKK